MITDPVALATAAIVVAVAGQWRRPLRRPDRPQPTASAAALRDVARSRPAHLRAVAVGAAIVSAVAAAIVLIGIGGDATVVAAMLLALVTVRRTLRRRTRSRRAAAAMPALVPDVVELVLVAVHAGLTPAQAVLGLRPYVASVLEPVVDEIGRRIDTGETLADSLTAFTEMGGPAFQPFVSALALAERTGDPLGPVLDRLADEARRDRRRLADTSARELPVRLTVPLVCCTLPAFLLLTIAPVLAGALSSLRASAP